jgi:hypothetical protein
MRVFVTGGSLFVGPMTDEKTAEVRQINSGKLLILVKRNTRNNREDGSKRQIAFGHAEEELKGVPVEVIDRIRHLPTPFMADIETERVSGGPGKPSIEQVIDVRPIADQSNGLGTAALKPVVAAKAA